MTDTRGRPGGWRSLTITGEASGRGLVPLRPMTIGDMLDTPFVLLRRHLRDVVLLVAVAVIPAQILSSYLQRGIFSGGFGGMLTDPEGFLFSMQAEQAGSGLPGLVGLVNSLLLLPLAVALVARLVVSSALGEQVGAGEVARATIRRAPFLFGSWLLALAAMVLPLAAAAGLMLLGGPFIAVGGLLLVLLVPFAGVVATLLIATPSVVVAEQVGVIAALRRSVAIVRPRFWAVVGTVLLAAIVSALAQTALTGLLGMLALGIEHDASWVLVALGSIFSQMVVLPYLAMVAALIYLDGLVRREALDVRILAGG